MEAGAHRPGRHLRARPSRRPAPGARGAMVFPGGDLHHSRLPGDTVQVVRTHRRPVPLHSDMQPLRRRMHPTVWCGARRLDGDEAAGALRPVDTTRNTRSATQVGRPSAAGRLHLRTAFGRRTASPQDGLRPQDSLRLQDGLGPQDSLRLQDGLGPQDARRSQRGTKKSEGEPNGEPPATERKRGGPARRSCGRRPSYAPPQRKRGGPARRSCGRRPSDAPPSAGEVVPPEGLAAAGRPNPRRHAADGGVTYSERPSSVSSTHKAYAPSAVPKGNSTRLMTASPSASRRAHER
jgi:hypothetical protein